MVSAQAPAGFAAARLAFEAAWAAQPAQCSTGFYCFAGRPVHFRLVGRALADALRRPFAHLALADLPAPPRLTVEVWDAGPAGVSYSEAALPDNSEQTWEVGGGFFASYAGGRYVRFWQPHGATWLDRAEGRMVGWRERGDALPIEERSKPLLLVLPVWYHDQQVQLIHAGLVARAGRGALIGGQGGSGKSTTTLACALAGFDYLGDDHVGLQTAGNGWLGHSLFGGARVDPDHLARFPALLPGAIPSDNPLENKALVQLGEVLPGRLARQAAVCAVILPRLTGQTAIRPASKADVLRRIGPSTLTMPLGAGADGLRRLRQLAESVPAFWLDLGPDIRQIPEAVDSILAQAGRP